MTRREIEPTPTDSGLSRRDFLRRAALGAAAVGGGSALAGWLSACAPAGAGGSSSGAGSPTAVKDAAAAKGAAGGTLKIGVLADLTGPISPFGKPIVNLGTLAIEDVNNAGGVLGRKLELVVEDTGSDNTVAVSKAKKLVSQSDIPIIMGTITSAMRDAVKGEIADRGGKLFIYPTLYEGGECNKNIFCTGAVPNQQVAPLVPYLAEKANGKNFYLVGADYVWPQVTNKAVRAKVSEIGGQVLGEEYFPLDATDFSTIVQKILASDTNVIYCTVIPPGIWTFLRQITEAGFKKKGVFCLPYLDESALTAVPADVLEDMVSCLEYYQVVDRPSDKAVLARYQKQFNDGTIMTSTGSGMYRAVHLWANAVNAAGSLENDKVRAALDSAKFEQSLGGPTAMVPGQHHVTLNMYLGVVKSGNIQVIKNLGELPPNEACKL